MQLRDYQKRQLAFLNENAFKGENIFLESPTGSGKTVVMAEYIKNRPLNYYTVSTGFNELVFQIADEFKAQGICTQVIIGKRNVACLKNGAKKGDEPFTREGKHACGDTLKCAKCEYANNACLYKKAINTASRVIVTNHSTLCIALQNPGVNPFIAGSMFIDECHTFGSFYESSLSLDIPAKKITNFMGLAEKYLPGEIQTSALQYAINNGCVNSKVLHSAMSALFDVISLRNMPERESNIVRALANYIDGVQFDNNSDIKAGVFNSPQISNGEFVGVHIAQFFDKVEGTHNNCVLLSATVDDYTKNIFDAKIGYEEDEVVHDYSKSRFVVYDAPFNRVDLEGFVSKQSAEHGLFLSTRLDLVEEWVSIGKIKDYEVIKDKKQFVDGKKQILIGSRKLFQGVDISGIGFIILNKLPFERYDELYKARMSYLDGKGHNSYNYYTLPYVENQLQQQIGRLWRNPEDSGEVALFDERAKHKHIGIVENVLKKRPGIKNNLYTV